MSLPIESALPRPGHAHTAPGAEERFSFRAMRSDGRVEIGELLAASKAIVRDRLVAEGLFPIRIDARVTLTGAKSVLPIADLALGFRLLASLLGSGLPMERSLAVFTHIAPRRWSGERLGRIRESVREGQTLGAAIRAAGLTLPAHVSGMLDAGEASGMLVDALKESAELMERTAEHRAALRGALAYPMILAIAGSAAVALLTGIVLPRFAELLRDVGQRLPPAAAILLAIADIVRRSWLGGAVVLGAATIVGVRFAVSPRHRRRIDAWLLATPGIGTIRHAAAGARLSAAVAAMLEAGVPIASALSHGAFAAGDAAVGTRVRDAREEVIRGERLSTALEHTNAVRTGVIQLIRAGEATGEMSDMLRTAARIEEAWSLSRIRMLTRLVEPMLILLFGGLIAFVAASLLQAVYAIRPMP